MKREYELACAELRKRIFITGYKGGMAHLASCFSSVEILYALYCDGVLKYNPSDLQSQDRDRFILSKGHAGLALYAVMVEAGIMDQEVFESYLSENALIGGEPCFGDIPGIEATTGSLGHGISMGVGMALGQKMDGNGAKTYVLVGDGECQEGTIWEAMMSAAALKLDNLVVILDSNKIQKMDSIENILGPIDWEARAIEFGWEVRRVDGHDVEAITECLMREKADDKPVFVIADTVKGKGVSIMENNPIWHFKLPNRKEKKVFMQELGISEEEME